MVASTSQVELTAININYNEGILVYVYVYLYMFMVHGTYVYEYICIFVYIPIRSQLIWVLKQSNGLSFKTSTYSKFFKSKIFL